MPKEKELVPIKIFNLAEAYGGGGTFFEDGLYKIKKARFVMFNFLKEGGDEACCMQLTLQRKDGSKEVGEPVVQHWPLEKKGDGNYKPINKGTAVAAVGDYPTIWRLSDFAIFMDHLQKAEFDLDKYEEDGDITALEDLEAEFGKYTKPGEPRKIVDDEGKEKPGLPYQVIVVTHIPKAGKSAKPKAEKEAAGKPNGKAKESTNGSGEFDAETVLAEYLAEHVFTEDNEAKGVQMIQARMGVTKYMPKKGYDVEQSKEVMALLKDKESVGVIAKAAGWELDGDKFVKAEE